MIHRLTRIVGRGLLQTAQYQAQSNGQTWGKRTDRGDTCEVLDLGTVPDRRHR